MIPQLRRSGKGVFRSSVYGCVEGEAGASLACLVQGLSSPQQEPGGRREKVLLTGSKGAQGGGVKWGRRGEGRSGSHQGWGRSQCWLSWASGAGISTQRGFQQKQDVLWGRWGLAVKAVPQATGRG